MSNGISDSSASKKLFTNLAVETNNRMDDLGEKINIIRGSGLDSSVQREIDSQDEIERQLDEDLEAAQDAAKPTALEITSTITEGLANIASAFGQAMGVAGTTKAPSAPTTQSTLDAAIKAYDGSPTSVTALNSALQTARARSAEIGTQMEPLNAAITSLDGDFETQSNYFKNQTTEALNTNADEIDAQNKVIASNEHITSQLMATKTDTEAAVAETNTAIETTTQQKDDATVQKNEVTNQITTIDGKSVEVKETTEGAIKDWQTCKNNEQSLSDNTANKKAALGSANSIDCTKYKTDEKGNQVVDKDATKAAEAEKAKKVNTAQKEYQAALKAENDNKEKIKTLEGQIKVGEQTLAELTAQKDKAVEIKETAIANIEKAVSDLTNLQDDKAEKNATLTNIGDNLRKTTASTDGANSAIAVVEQANTQIAGLQLDQKKVEDKAKGTKKELKAQLSALEKEKKSLDKSIEKAENKLGSKTDKTDKTDKADKADGTPATPATSVTAPAETKKEEWHAPLLVREDSQGQDGSSSSNPWSDISKRDNNIAWLNPLGNDNKSEDPNDADPEKKKKVEGASGAQ